VLVRSRRMQAAQGQALEPRLPQAEAEFAELLLPRRGKTRPTTPEEADTAILERHQVVGLLEVAHRGAKGSGTGFQVSGRAYQEAVRRPRR